MIGQIAMNDQPKWMPPAPLHTGEALFSILEDPIITISGVSHIVLIGLALEATRGSGIVIEAGDDVRVVGCLLRTIVYRAIHIYSGIGHGVVSCDIFDTGDGGVLFTNAAGPKSRTFM